MVTVGTPYAEVEFATESGDIEIRQTALIHDKSLDLDILSINTGRDVGSDDCATFTIQLIYRDSWYNNIQGNDLVVINLGRDGVAHPVLFGMVDNIYKSWSFVDLEPVRSITISGRGFNKVFMQFGIGAVQEVDIAHSVVGFFKGQDEGFGQSSPPAVIKTVIDYYADKGIDVKFANGKNWRDYAQFVLREHPDQEESLTNFMNYYSFQGGLWDYIKELRNAPFYETYWEIEKGKPTFFVRPTPFNPDQWKALRRRGFTGQELVDTQLGRSDLETYTLFSVKGLEIVSDFDNLFGVPLWYKPFYRKYGLRRLEVKSKYIKMSENTSEEDNPGIYQYANEEERRKAEYDQQQIQQVDDRVKEEQERIEKEKKETQREYQQDRLSEIEVKERETVIKKEAKSILQKSIEKGQKLNKADLNKSVADAVNKKYSEDRGISQRLQQETQKAVQNVMSEKSFQKELETIEEGSNLGQYQEDAERLRQVIEEANTLDNPDRTVNQKTIDIFNWNILNCFFENGTMVLKGNADYKIGERLFDEEIKKEYYIEKVSHDFKYNEQWVTNLEVTRGLEPDKRFKSPWGDWEPMTSDDLFDISGIDTSTIDISSMMAMDDGMGGGGVIQGGTALGQGLLRYAQTRIGDRYSLNSSTTNGPIDCSGLVWRAMQANGYEGSRFSTLGFTDLARKGILQEIPLSQRQPGDILWMSGHTGLCFDEKQSLEATPPKVGYYSFNYQRWTKAYRWTGKTK